MCNIYIYIYIYRGNKITCPGARDKLNFRQDKHIFLHPMSGGQVKNAVQVYLKIYWTIE